MTAVASRTDVDLSAVPSTDLDSPFVRLDLDVVEARFRGLQMALPATAVHYAVKANPHPDVLRRLVAAGASFDVAGPGEITACLRAGAAPERLLYSNPIKRRADIAFAHAQGVAVFVVDSMDEVAKVAAAASVSFM